MRIRCWKCGHAGFIFTTSDGHFGKHHGAVCANCQKPVTLKDCLFKTKAMGTVHGEEEECRITAEKTKLPQRLTELFGPTGKR